MPSSRPTQATHWYRWFAWRPVSVYDRQQKPGAERILAFLARGAIVGELSIIDAPFDVGGGGVSCGIELSQPRRVQAFAERHPELCESLLRLLAKRVRDRYKMVAATSFLWLKGRIAQTLLELADHFEQEVDQGGS